MFNSRVSKAIRAPLLGLLFPYYTNHKNLFMCKKKTQMGSGHRKCHLEFLLINQLLK